MKRVAILKSNLSHQGGVEKYTLRLAHAFADQGCHVTVLTTGFHPQGHYFPFKIVNLQPFTKIAFARLWHFDHLCQQWLKQHPHDIIFGMDRNTHQTHYRAGNGVHAEYLEKRSKISSFLKRLTFKINPLHRSFLALEKKTYENPSLKILFTNSNMVREEILKHYTTDAKKIVVVHNGVEWHEMQEEFAVWPQVKAARLSNFGLNPEAMQLLFIGKGFKRKGLHHLLKALAALKDSPYSFQLSVLGDDKELNKFIKISRSLGLEQQVKFFGHRHDTHHFYQTCDVLVLPSLYDPFANVTLEALAMGLFVITTKMNGASEILTPNTGKIIEHFSNQSSLKTALEEVLRKGKKTVASAQQIRESVQHLDFSHQLHKIVSVTLCQQKDTTSTPR